MKVNSLVLFFLTLAFVTVPLIAATPFDAPQLEFETGSHQGRLFGLSLAGETMATAGWDKTLRLWSLPSGKLLRTIRPPASAGDDGYLFSATLSPDGKLVACGGFASAGERDFSAFVFSCSTGSLVKRLAGFTSPARGTAFSPDGSLLAVCDDRTGIRFFRTSDWSPAGQVLEPGSFGPFAFSPTGSYIAASLKSGKALRIVDARDGAWVARPDAAIEGKHIVSDLAVSPDGSRVAISFQDSLEVQLFDLASGAVKRRILKAGEAYSGRSTLGVAVAFSLDGKWLYAAGNVWKDGKLFMRRWQANGSGSPKDFYHGLDTGPMRMAAASDGALIFAAYTGTIARVLPGDKPEAVILSERGGFQRQAQKRGMPASAGGQSFRLWKGEGQDDSFIFSLRERSLGSSAVEALDKPILSDPKLSVGFAQWKESFSLNGKPIQMPTVGRSPDLAVSYAILPDRSGLIVGTTNLVLRYAADGRLVWRSAGVYDSVCAVNASGDGRLVLAYSLNGVVRWLRASDGAELLSLFIHRDLRRWIAWTPSGYYDCSPGGEGLIGWRINAGPDAAADFYPASRFKAKFRPDVVALALESPDEVEALRRADEAAGRKAAAATAELALPPVVTILSPADGSAAGEELIAIRYAVKSPAGAPVTGLRASVDGRPVEAARGVDVAARDGAELSLTIANPKRDCEISLVAFNKNAASVPATVRLRWEGPKVEAAFVAKPKLYVLAVGVSAYRDPALRLGLAAKDARDLAAALKAQEGGIYREVVVKQLVDEQATRDEILDGLDWLRTETTARDVAILFMAGHGVNDQAGDYYFLPQGADTQKLMRTCVEYGAIKNTLASIAGKAVFFVDTCHSGNVMGTRRGAADLTSVVNELSSAENGAVVFASSSGKQFSLEDAAWGNGAFTKALIEGLAGGAAYTGDGRITINMLDLFLSEEVKKLTGGRQTPTTTKPETISDFPIAIKQ